MPQMLPFWNSFKDYPNFQPRSFSQISSFIPNFFLCDHIAGTTTRPIALPLVAVDRTFRHRAVPTQHLFQPYSANHFSCHMWDRYISVGFAVCAAIYDYACACAYSQINNYSCSCSRWDKHELLSHSRLRTRGSQSRSCSKCVSERCTIARDQRSCDSGIEPIFYWAKSSWHCYRAFVYV